MRIEDTDAERSTQESIQGILDGLNWLNIDWDEGPYFQTEFEHEHEAVAVKLLQEDKAYKCFCTKEELDAKRETAKKNKTQYGYDGSCRNLSREEVTAKEAAGLPFVVRFKVPELTGEVGYDDKVLGHIKAKYNEIEDFVIVRSTGKPLYLLCNVVDDIRDRITHIIRGSDHMTNTIRQVLLYKALDAPIPVFAHMPLTLDTQKAKISKRKHGEIVAVQFYEQKGFIPWALSNFLVLLGWAPGNDTEFFSKEELIKAFSLERINSSNSVFNYQKGKAKFFTDPKAIAFNEHYLRTMPIEEIGQLVKPFLVAEDLWDKAYADEKKEWYLSTLDLIRGRFQMLSDFCDRGRAYFSDTYPVEQKPLKKNVLKHDQLKTWLPMLADRYESLADYSLETTEKATRDLAEELDIQPGILINGMRTVVTGQLAGPSMFDILIAIGKKRVIARLRDVDRLYIDSDGE